MSGKFITIRGEVVLPPEALKSPDGDLLIQIEDVSRADAPSVVIGEQRQVRVRLHEGATIPFAVQVPAPMIEKDHSYSVRAHVDLSGSGEVESGDLVSTQSYPVLTGGYSNMARVKVKRV